MSSSDFVVPFGIRILEDGTEKTVYLDDIGATEDDVAANYGRRCGLVCPECGQPILAVRRQQGNNGKGFKCFAHASGASAHCEGYGERSSHKAAEDMLVNGIGETFWLPAVNVSDLVAHTSRYSDSGTERDEVMEVFESREDVNCFVPEGPRLAKGLVASPVVRSLCLAHLVLTSHPKACS